ncbi:hypothetical protein [Bradyrhizobium sp. JYMT SZCCT0428]|uniref:hypothetical protein n=1 Tax=Bradyrhizobium sp. JYMT SZCCT0428 TaxID=2807673 RepID=UPI001BA4C4ED|nr:hypothetical protein [Bradyrhizobium sp. JYMT SZCCT0428]MBR1153695.1 hypothetical protein [Bradyrhizobium sp. JYMT SZCCT0428]
MTRTVILLGLLCLFSGSIAYAQNTGCAAVSDERERLACFDNKKTSKETKPAAKTDAPPMTALQLIENENKKVNARIKNICRGC